MADSSHASANSSEPAPNRKRRRKWPWVLLVIVLVLGGLVVGAPTLLSTDAGTKWLVGQINNRIVGTLAVDNLDLSWLGSQTAEGATLRDADGNVVLQNASIELSDLTLLAAAQGTKDLGSILVKVEDGALARDAAGKLNLTEALAMKQPSPPSAKTETGWRGRVEYKIDRLELRAPNMNAAELVNASGNVTLATLNDIAVDFDLTVAQGGERGDLKGDVKVNQLFDAFGETQLAAAELGADMTVTRLPLAPIGRIAGFGGVLEDFVGKQLSGDVNVSGKLERINAEIQFQSQQMKTARLIIRREGDVLVIDRQSYVEGVVEGEDVARYVNKPDAEQPIAFGNDVDYKVEFIDVTIPAADGVDINRMTGQFKLTTSPTSLQVAGRDPVELGKLEGRITGEPERRTLRLTMNGNVKYRDFDSQLQANIGVSNELTDGKPDWSKLKVDGRVEAPDLPADAVDPFISERQWVRTTLGDVMTLAVKINIAPSGDSFAGDATVTVEAPNLKETATVTADITPQHVKVRPGVIATLQVSEELETKLTAMAGELPEMLRGLKVDAGVLQVELAELVVPIGNFVKGDVQLGGVLTLDRLTPGGVARLKDTELRDVRLTVPAGKLSQAKTPTFSVVLAYGPSTSDVQGEVALKPLTAQTPGFVQARAKLLRVPTAMLDQLRDDPAGSLSKLLERQLDSVVVEYGEHGVDPALKTLLVDVRSRRLVVDKFRLVSNPQQQRYYIPRDITNTVALELTPSGYEALRAMLADPDATLAGASKLELANTVKLTWELRQADLTMFTPAEGEADAAVAATDEDAERPQPLPIDASRSSFVTRLTFSEPPMFVDRQSRKRYELREPHFGLRTGENLARSITVDSGGKLVTMNGAREVATKALVLKTTFHEFIDDKNHLAMQRLRFTDATVSGKLPMEVFLNLTGGDPKLADAIGSIVSFGINGDYPGNLTAKVDSELVDVGAELIQRDNAITLEKTAGGSVMVTRTFSTQYLRSGAVIFAGLESIREPAKFQVLPEDFNLPAESLFTLLLADDRSGLQERMLRQMRADIVIDLGEMRIVGQSLLSVVAKLIPGSGTRDTVKFSPGRFRVRDGRVTTLQPLQMQYDRLSMSLSGNQDLISRKVQMMLSIHGSTFEKVDGLKDLIPPDESLDLPITGTISEPKLDTARLTQAIARLGIKRGIREATGGSEEGEVIGGIIGGILGGKQKQDDGKGDDSGDGGKMEDNDDTSTDEDDSQSDAKKDDRSDDGAAIIGSILDQIRKAKEEKERRKEEERRKREEAN